MLTGLGRLLYGGTPGRPLVLASKLVLPVSRRMARLWAPSVCRCARHSFVDPVHRGKV